jgi:hypothetical protein
MRTERQRGFLERVSHNPMPGLTRRVLQTAPAPLRRFEEPWLGGYESGLLARTNPWEVVSFFSSGALRTVA